MDIFKDMSRNALSIISNLSETDDTVSTITTDAGTVAIDVIIDMDVEIINKSTEDRGDDGLIIANTATFDTMDLKVGDTLTVDSKEWMIGQTIEDDGFVMTVIVT